MSRLTRSLVAIGAVASLALGGVGAAQARHGADDPVGHDRGDDHGASAARHGADDGPGHKRREDRRHHHHRHGGR